MKSTEGERDRATADRKDKENLIAHESKDEDRGKIKDFWIGRDYKVVI